MGYYDTLDEMLKKSGLTLQEVADRCETDYGVKINRSYISKLKTGKQAPASDDVNEAIAKVCGGNVEEFLYEAYIEKAPEFIRNFIKNLMKDTRDIIITSYRNKVTEREYSLLEIYFNQLSDLEIAKILSQNSYNSDIQFEKPEEINVSKIQNGSSSTSVYILEMEDDSMEPTIPKGAIIRCDKTAKIAPGDIVVAISTLDQTGFIRRYYPVSSELDVYEPEIDREIIFTCDNPNYRPIVENVIDIEIVSKVISVTTTRNL